MKTLLLTAVLVLASTSSFATQYMIEGNCLSAEEAKEYTDNLSALDTCGSKASKKPAGKTAKWLGVSYMNINSTGGYICINEKMWNKIKPDTISFKEAFMVDEWFDADTTANCQKNHTKMNKESVAESEAQQAALAGAGE